MRNEVLKNYLTPKPLAKLVKILLLTLKIPSHQCCAIHGDSNVKAYRLVKSVFLYCDLWRPLEDFIKLKYFSLKPVVALLPLTNILCETTFFVYVSTKTK